MPLIFALAFFFDPLPLRGGAHSTTTFLRRMATEFGAVGHFLVAARDRKIGLAGPQRGNAVDRARGRDHASAGPGFIAGEFLRQRLDQVLVVAARRPDRNAQGRRPQRQQECR